MNKALHHINQHMGAFLKQVFGSGLPLLTGTGSTGAKLLIAYDMPGREDITAVYPFERMKKRLDEMLEEIGTSIDDTYLTYIIKFVPHGKRLAYEEEALSLPWFAREIEAVKPKVVVTLGATALSILGIREPLAKIHGQAVPLKLYGVACTLVPLFHPERLKQADIGTFHEGLQEVGRWVRKPAAANLN